MQFRKLAELETTEAGAILDVCGIVDSVEAWAIITRKDGSDTRKRSLAIRDDSGRSVEVSGSVCCGGRAGLLTGQKITGGSDMRKRSNAYGMKECSMEVSKRGGGGRSVTDTTL